MKSLARIGSAVITSAVLLSGVPAQADDIVGGIKQLRGDVRVIRNGVPIAADVGMWLMEGDLLDIPRKGEVEFAVNSELPQLKVRTFGPKEVPITGRPIQEGSLVHATVLALRAGQDRGEQVDDPVARPVWTRTVDTVFVVDLTGLPGPWDPMKTSSRAEDGRSVPTTVKGTRVEIGPLPPGAPVEWSVGTATGVVAHGTVQVLSSKEAQRCETSFLAAGQAADLHDRALAEIAALGDCGLYRDAVLRAEEYIAGPLANDATIVALMQGYQSLLAGKTGLP